MHQMLKPRGGALPLWESVGMRRGFAPHFRHLHDLFAPQNWTMSTILFRSCWVPFRSPTFSACRLSFCPPNRPTLLFYSYLVGSRFELRAAHPYWFWPGVPPPGWNILISLRGRQPFQWFFCSFWTIAFWVGDQHSLMLFFKTKLIRTDNLPNSCKQMMSLILYHDVLNL